MVKLTMEDLSPTPRPKPRKCRSCSNQLPADLAPEWAFCTKCCERMEREATNRRYEEERREDLRQAVVRAFDTAGIPEDKAIEIVFALRAYLKELDNK